MSEPMVSRSTAVEQLRASDTEWRNGVRSFDRKPDRMRRLAEAAKYRASALQLAALAGLQWEPRPGAHAFRLAYELQDDSQRQGPSALWRQFDAARRQMADSMAADSISDVADAFSTFAAALIALADALDTDTEKDKTTGHAEQTRAG